MKRLLYLLCSLVLACCLLFSFASCSNKDKNNPPDNPPSDQTETNPPSTETAPPSGENNGGNTPAPEAPPTDTSSSAGLEFTLNPDGATYTLTSVGSCTDSHVVIGTYQFLPVTAIADSAFSGYCTMTEITIPNTVTGIGKKAFYDCRGLTSVTIPNSVTRLEQELFCNCYSLESITIPNSVTEIGESAFAYCLNLNNVILPETITRIDDGTFACCYQLANITIPNSVTTIGDSAFSSCIALTSITLGSGLTSIEVDAFDECHKLVEVINHSNLNLTVGSEDNGQVAEYAKEIHTGESKIAKVGEYLFYTHDGTNYLLGHTGYAAVLTLPENYNGSSYEIYPYAFWLDYKLTSITIPSSVTSIGESAIEECLKLVEVINHSNVNLDDYFEEVHTGESKISKVGEYLFYTHNGTNYLLSYTGHDTVLTLPENYNGNSYEIYPYAFWYSPAIRIHIGGGVTSIGEDAFYGCIGLQSITVPGNVKNIGRYAFTDCRALANVTLENGVERIEQSAFTRCTSLNSITIPSSVTSVGDYIFGSCSKLVEIINLSNVTITESAPKEIHTGESKIKRVGDYLFYTYGTTNYLLGYTGSSSSLTLPETYEGSSYEIYPYAFAYCYRAKHMVIPNGITNIGEYAFSDCFGLSEIILPNNLTCIGKNTFADCSGLTHLSIPNSVTSIGEEAFSYCSGLTALSLPSSVTSIGERAFWRCSALTNLSIPNTLKNIGRNAFNGCTNLAYTEYDNALYLGNAENPYLLLVQAKDQSITSCTVHEQTKVIASYAFSRCNALTTLSVPNGITNIGDYAFDCNHLTYNEDNDAFYLGNDQNPYVVLIKTKNRSLTSFTIPEQTKVIYQSAFYNCYHLENITIPNGVVSIGKEAFKASALESVTIGSGVTNIGESAFPGLTTILVDANNPSYHVSGNCLIETASKTLIRGAKTALYRPTEVSQSSAKRPLRIWD